MAKATEPLTPWVVLRRLCVAFLRGVGIGLAWIELERILRQREERDKRCW